jgi:hypothetical protein
MGRPLAIVRASLDLQLHGQPALHQGWPAFISSMHGAGRDTDAFQQVQLSVRLGEQHQLNDGLAGYWIERAASQLGPVFHTPVDEAAVHPAIQGRAGNEPPLSVTVAAPARRLTLLLDPRGTLHATTGILPTKVLGIPPAHYAQALRNIAVTFQVAPLLSDQGKTRLELPVEAGLSWSWLEQPAPGRWRELFPEPTISRQLLQEKLPEPAAFWDQLTAAGWLRADNRLADPDVAFIVARDQRPPLALAPELLANLDRVLDAYAQYLQPLDTTAAFAGPQLLREGWLKLQSSPEPV